MDKFCPGCKTLKHESDFQKNLAKKDGLQGYCRLCKKEYDRLEYQKRPLEQHARNRKNVAKYRKEISDYKASKGCSKCDEKDPRCLDFHHTEPSNKIDTVSKLIIFGRKRAWEEIKKCEILCANCHRKEHILLDD